MGHPSEPSKIFFWRGVRTPVGRVETRITFWNSREKRDSLFYPKFSRDYRETRESKLVVRQKFCSENCEKRVSLRNFVARPSSYEFRRKNFCSKTRFSRVLQTNFVVRLASLATRNFVARLARIIPNFNCGVLQESCKNFGSNNNFSLWIMILLVCESRNLRDSQIARLTSSQYIAFFPSHETRKTHKTRTDNFARSESHFPQNSCEKNCETRLAVNPTCG
jgi:hypothetical protein